MKPEFSQRSKPTRTPLRSTDCLDQPPREMRWDLSKRGCSKIDSLQHHSLTDEFCKSSTIRGSPQEMAPIQSRQRDRCAGRPLAARPSLDDSFSSRASSTRINCPTTKNSGGNIAEQITALFQYPKTQMLMVQESLRCGTATRRGV